MIFVCREEVEVFCHVVWAVVRQVSTGEAQAGADTFVSAVWRAAADRRARFPAFPSLPGSSVSRVLQILEVDLTFFFFQRQAKMLATVLGIHIHMIRMFLASRIRIHQSEVWIRILSFSHKGVGWTEIMLEE
jgi:hypothetical protein